MKVLAPSMCLLVSIVQCAMASPVIKQTGNAFGLRLLISAHTAVARGSLMAILGDELGPDGELTAAANPDPNLAGVSVVLTASGKSYILPLTSARRTRVVGLVPADTPLGNATVALSYGGS